MIQLDPAASLPLVAQIVEAIRSRVQSGIWLDGMKLPSIRKLATSCAVSPLTVSNAYNRLVAEGFLQARPASGYFVTHELAPPSRQEKPLSHPPSVDSLCFCNALMRGESDRYRRDAGGCLRPSFMAAGCVLRSTASAVAQT
ncbi:GntR family transcriptional regulator [Asaia astilbis]|uniref:GntR family transcriptional regulator n=1 Tax=Asaia astilbis TaxID=610244 RepID=UPI000ABA5ED1|nr:winged helix-turn-helix domain-containing protein [Asaia astilbis]